MNAFAWINRSQTLLSIVLHFVACGAILSFTLVSTNSAAARTPLVEIPDSGIKFLRTCRDDNPEIDKFIRGYCFGYIYSKVERLTREQECILAENQIRYKQKFGPLKYDIHATIYNLLNSDKFSKFKVHKMGIAKPITTEKLLDHIIETLVYKERI